MANGIVARYGNEIRAENLAKLRNFIAGNTFGIVDGLQGTATQDTSEQYTANISAGTMLAYGFFGITTGTSTFFLRIPSYDRKVYQIYGEIDISTQPSTFEIKCKDNGASTSRSFRQDVLAVEKTGVFQLLLCEVTVYSDGNMVLQNEPNGLKMQRAKYADVITSKVADGVTAVTQASTDNSEKVATTAFARSITG